MGLKHPLDLNEWHRWQQSRSRVHSFKKMVSGGDDPSLYLALRGQDPQLLVALDAAKPTSIASYIKPLKFFPDQDLAVLAPADISTLLPGAGWRTARIFQHDTVPRSLVNVRAVLAAGHFLPAGAAAYRWSRGLNARFMVVQHGLMTPHAPPLPEGAHLLAFNMADASFWSSGRQDVTFDVVGSQLFWESAQQPVAQFDVDRPVFLGQLHGAELPRLGLARTSSSFCISTGATYRPHPSETDKLSRLQHRWWEKRGMRIDRSGVPLTEVTAPIVSVFSTGVLEAAARGIPSWVTYARPPRWLEEFWERYAMSRWGSEPTPAPAQPRHEPAAAIARILKEFIGDPS